MKRLTYIVFLSFVMVSILSCVSGCNNESDTVSNTDVITISEYERGIEYGFLINSLEGHDPDKTTVTWEQYCSILENMIRLKNESAVPVWKELTAKAPKTDIKRDGAMIALFFAGKTLDIENRNNGEDFLYESYNWGEQASWNYPIFPWDSPSPSEDELMNDPNNAVGPAYVYSTCRVSLVSERPLLDVDYGTGDLHLNNDLTLRDAITSVVRLYESEEYKPANYISVYDVTTYDKNIITDELLGSSSELPEVTQQMLPSDWKGAGISARKDGRHLQQNFMESDIAFLAENGFNFTRVFLGFSTLRYPDFPADPTQVNETELLELDQLIAWGIEYDVHIQLSMVDTPNDLESFDLTNEEWENIRAYWELLTRRYAGIPSRYLSFDLANELQPSEEHFHVAVTNMNTIVSDIRTADPDRVLLISFHDNPDKTWVKNMAELGIALGCHPYSPKYLNDGSDIYTAAAEYWPYPYIPTTLYPDESIKISGDIGGNILKLDFWVYRPFVISFDDGTTYTIDVQGDYIHEESCDWRFYEPYPIEIPENITEIVITPKDELFKIHELIMECDGEIIGIVPVDIMADRSRGSSELIWNEKGWSSEKNYSADMIYKELIQPMQKIADENNVGFMCNEFGIYACNVGWDINVVKNYTDDVLTMLEEKNIPWCFCEMEGWPYRFLTVPENRPYEWENATLESKTYVFEDNTGRTFQYCKELLETFQKYTMN